MAGHLAAPAAGPFHEQFYEIDINKDFILGFHNDPEMQRVFVDPAVPGTEAGQFTTGLQVIFYGRHGASGKGTGRTGAAQ